MLRYFTALIVVQLQWFQSLKKIWKIYINTLKRYKNKLKKKRQTIFSKLIVWIEKFMKLNDLK